MPLETFTPQQLGEMPAFQQTVTGPDTEWVENLKDLSVGSGFRVRRDEGETARQVKRRVNAAAAVHFKELLWKPEQTNLPANQEPTSWVVKVKSLNTKKKAEAEAKARQDGQTAPSQPVQPTQPQNQGSEGTQTQTAASGPRNRP